MIQLMCDDVLGDKVYFQVDLVHPLLVSYYELEQLGCKNDKINDQKEITTNYK